MCIHILSVGPTTCVQGAGGEAGGAVGRTTTVLGGDGDEMNRGLVTAVQGRISRGEGEGEGAVGAVGAVGRSTTLLGGDGDEMNRGLVTAVQGRMSRGEGEGEGGGGGARGGERGAGGRTAEILSGDRDEMNQGLAAVTQMRRRQDEVGENGLEGLWDADPAEGIIRNQGELRRDEINVGETVNSSDGLWNMDASDASANGQGRDEVNDGSERPQERSDSRDPLKRLRDALARWSESHLVTEFEFKEISLGETGKLVSRMGRSSACGLDGLDSNFLKLVLPSIVGPLRHITNASLRHSTWANKWKLGKILPLLKDKSLDTTSPASFRPVCILPTVSKIVERAAQRQLQEFFEKTGQLNTAAHAYRASHSTTTTIASISDDIFQAAEHKKIAQVMTMDQSAAFDCVSHEILIQKLREYRVGEKAIKWVRAYLSLRSQFVRVGTADSQMVALSRGVPQGSCIGPLFYAVFVNDITEITRDENCEDVGHRNNSKLFGEPCSNCGIITTYADDSTYVVSSLRRERNGRKIKETLRKMNDFLLENELHLNEGKTHLLECMIPQKRGRLGGSPPQLEVVTDEGEAKIILDTGMCRILGTNLQANMSWLAHLETGERALLPAVRKSLGALQKLGKIVPRECRKTLAEGLIVSKLLYLLPVWGSTTANQMRKGQILLSKAARWVTGMRRSTRTSTLMREVGWMNLIELQQQHSCVLFWKILHLGAPGHLRGKLVIEDDWKVVVERTRIKFTERSFMWKTGMTWNELPESLRKEKSVAVFKTQLKRWIMNRRARVPD